MITRIARHRSAHRAFCQSVNAKLTVPTADVEMLFDPAKQKLDLPSGLVEGGDVDGGALEVIGQKGDSFAVGSLDPEPAQSDWQNQIALAGEAHLTVLEHGETIALRARDGALANDVEAHLEASLDPRLAQTGTRIGRIFDVNRSCVRICFERPIRRPGRRSVAGAGP